MNTGDKPRVMEESQKTRLRSYAWNYFAYHAEQRLKTFQFYLGLIAALAAGIVALLPKAQSNSLARLPSYGCFVIAFLSLMFCWLDRRNARLAKNGEAALSYLDTLEGHPEEGEPHVLALFIADDHATKIKPKHRHISYTDVLTVIFATFGIIAIIFGITLWA